MSDFRDADRPSQEHFFHHCAQAFKKYETRDFAIAEMHKQLRKLKTLNKKANYTDLSGDLEELEKRIGLALEKERFIIQHVMGDNSFQGRINQKINLLDNKFGKFLDGQKNRSLKIAEIESQVTGAPVSIQLEEARKARVHNLLRKMESKLRRLSQKKQSNKVKIKLLKEKIDHIKKRVQDI